MSDTKLGGAGSTEFDAIRAMRERWGARAVGIGDDAAILDVPRGDVLVASVDTAVENRHFKRAKRTPRDIGYRSVTAALSDLAAMAASPLGVLVALAVPPSWRDVLLDLADGIGDAVDAARTTIRGGNLSDAAELSITTTVLGSAFQPLSRSGAHAGEAIFVTGQLGGASDRRRVARIDEARWLAGRGATAAIDISDGLASDLSHIAAASGVSLEIALERLPVFAGASPMAALASGEEYELALTAPADIDRDEFARRFGISLSEIGRVVAGDAGVVVMDGGKRVAPPKGYDHFS